MPRRTGRNSGNGQFIPIAQAKAMGDRATVETVFAGRISQAMRDAGVDAVSRLAKRPDLRSATTPSMNW